MLRFSITLLLCLFLQNVYANPQVVLETSKGDIIIELFEKDAPISTKNFLSYVESGFYNGTIFHRVIPTNLIQGGGFSKDLSKKKIQEPIQNEASEKLKNLRGTVAMARLSAPHSATSQFFINLLDNASYDYEERNMGYAVFGKVTEDTMRVVDIISYVETGTTGMFRDVPVDPIEIIKAYRTKDSVEESKDSLDI